MGSDLDTATYMMAYERTVNMIFVIEQTLEFMAEYKVEADEEVRKAISPLIDDLKKWIK